MFLQSNKVTVKGPAVESVMMSIVWGTASTSKDKSAFLFGPLSSCHNSKIKQT